MESPEAVEASRGHVAQIERGRSRPPYSVRVQRDLVIKINIRILVPLVAGKARAQKAFLQCSRLRDTDCLAVELRASSLLGGKQLIARGIVNDRGNALARFSGRSLFEALVFQSNRHAKNRKSVCEAGRAVHG